MKRIIQLIVLGLSAISFLYGAASATHKSAYSMMQIEKAKKAVEDHDALLKDLQEKIVNRLNIKLFGILGAYRNIPTEEMKAEAQLIQAISSLMQVILELRTKEMAFIASNSEQ